MGNGVAGRWEWEWEGECKGRVELAISILSPLYSRRMRQNDPLILQAHFHGPFMQIAFCIDFRVRNFSVSGPAL